MARLTKGTFLMYKATAGGTYSKLCDITEYPDLDQNLATEDSTTLSDAAHTYIGALPDSGGAYTFNTWLKAWIVLSFTALSVSLKYCLLSE